MNHSIRRRRRFVLGLALAAAANALASRVGLAQQPPPSSQPTPSSARPADAALATATAERFAVTAARAEARGDDASLRAAAAFYDLARAAAPGEARFARASADVLMRLGERERAVDALAKLRAIEPGDQLAQIQFFDLVMAGLETADARAAYAERVMNAAAGVLAEVRSHAATQLMEVNRQRGLDAEAAKALETALALDPSNVAACAARYAQLVDAGAKPMDRARALSQLCLASPADPQNLMTFARECERAGDYDDASAYYRLSFAIAGANGQRPSADEVVDYAAAELLAGRPDAAGAMLDAAANAIPDDGRLYSLSLLRQQLAGASSESLKDAIDAARGVYLARLAGVSTLLNDPAAKAMPATRPAPPMPDVAADVAKLNAAGDDDAGAGQLSTAYAVALSELTWFDLFFRAASVEDARIAAVRSLLGDDAAIATRFEGWRLLDAGKADEAKLKFDAVADRDGFARLGQAEVSQQKGDAAGAKAILASLAAARPTGLFGAHVAQASARLGVKVAAADVDPELVRLAASTRQDVTAMLDRPRDFYLLTADFPGTVSFGFGEPILARLTLLNTGRRPITVGPRGYVSGTFVVDAQVRGTAPQGFPATVVGQLGGAVRLDPRESVSQTVRIDAGALGDYLRAHPGPLVTLSGFVTTNAVATARGSSPSPGGEQTQVGNIFERRTSPLDNEGFRAKVVRQLGDASAASRVAAGELIAATLNDAGENAGDAAGLREALSKQAAAETDPIARAWLSAYASATPDALATLAGGGDDATAAAALAIAIDRPSAARKQVAERASSAFKESTIRELASSVAAMPDAPATTQP